tara:strand:+ start:252 stop:416 length:165 start_codon:yes stop_codon:yes gene_type:complete
MTKAQASKRLIESAEKIEKVLNSKHSAFMGKARQKKLFDTLMTIYDMADYMKRK